MRRLAVAIAAIVIATTPLVARAAGHILVTDAPADFAVVAKALGFSRIEAMELEKLKISGYRVAVPAAHSPEIASEILKNAFPNAVCEIEDSIEMSELAN